MIRAPCTAPPFILECHYRICCASPVFVRVTWGFQKVLFMPIYMCMLEARVRSCHAVRLWAPQVSQAVPSEDLTLGAPLVWFSQHDGPLPGRCCPPACLTTVEGLRLVWTLIKGNLTKMEWGGLKRGLSLRPTGHQGLSITDPAEESSTGKSQLQAPQEKVHIASPTRNCRPQNLSQRQALITQDSHFSPVHFRSKQPFQLPPFSINNVPLICLLDLRMVLP